MAIAKDCSEWFAVDKHSYSKPEALYCMNCMSCCCQMFQNHLLINTYNTYEIIQSGQRSNQLTGKIMTC